ncbi:MAG TPA: epimerase [Thermoanaerobaculia bacterium]|nr:epimerase [Thermoanaerobaculia bacterium]HXT50254.1 epimerase [Thermoanaerobaculia bacterium]
MSASRLFIAGGTGYLGPAAAAPLLARGHRLTMLVRPGSERRVPAGVEAVAGNALDPAAYTHGPDDTLLLLVGTPHPAPWKAAQFEAVDFAAGRAAATALQTRPARHVVYLSVAHPAPSMHAYWRVRERVEALLTATGVPATFLRPWYVLGPGHRWAVLLKPLYWLAERVPASRETARRLGLVTLPQMVAALVAAVENPPPSGTRVVEVPQIRAADLSRS